MFALGLILVLLAVIVVIYVLIATGGEPAMTIDWFVFSAEITPLGLFLLGAATVLVLSIGSVLLSIGLKQSGAKRAEVKKLRKEAKAHEQDGGQGESHDRKRRSSDSDSRRDDAPRDSGPKEDADKSSRRDEGAARRDDTSARDRTAKDSPTDRDVPSGRADSGGTTQSIPPAPPPPRK